MKVSFEGIGQEIMTFTVNEAAPAAGNAVVLSGNGEVQQAGTGSAFIGICKSVCDGFAAIQTRGVVTCAYTGSTAPAVGYGKLAAAKDSVSVNNAGREYLILAVDSTAKTVTFVL